MFLVSLFPTTRLPPEIRQANKVGGQFRQPNKKVLHRDVTLAVLFMGHYKCQGVDVRLYINTYPQNDLHISLPNVLLCLRTAQIPALSPLYSAHLLSSFHPASCTTVYDSQTSSAECPLRSKLLQAHWQGEAAADFGGSCQCQRAGRVRSPATERN